MIRRSFFSTLISSVSGALISLPYLGFLKSKPITMAVDVGKEVHTSTEPNTFRELYKFIKENNARLIYDKKTDCFVLEYLNFTSSIDRYYCAFKGAEIDETPDGTNYTKPALLSLDRTRIEELIEKEQLNDSSNNP